MSLGFAFYGDKDSAWENASTQEERRRNNGTQRRHNEKVHASSNRPNLRADELGGYVTRKDIKNAYRILVGKLEAAP
jgi:hypothetical protein